MSLVTVATAMASGPGHKVPMLPAGPFLHSVSLQPPLAYNLCPNQLHHKLSQLQKLVITAQFKEPDT